MSHGEESVYRKIAVGGKATERAIVFGFRNRRKAYYSTHLIYLHLLGSNQLKQNFGQRFCIHHSFSHLKYPPIIEIATFDKPQAPPLCIYILRLLYHAKPIAATKIAAAPTANAYEM